MNDLVTSINSLDNYLEGPSIDYCAKYNERFKLYETIATSKILDKDIKTIIDGMLYKQNDKYKTKNVNQKNLNKLKKWLQKFEIIKRENFPIWAKNIKTSLKKSKLTK